MLYLFRMNVVGYVRVSTDEQSLGIEMQRKAIEELCKIEGFTLIDVKIDENVSGSTDPFTRPGFKQAIELALRYDKIIITYSLDRIVRDLAKLMDLQTKLKELGIIILPVQNFNFFIATLHDPVWYYIALFFIGLGAKYERDMIRERTRLAMNNPEEPHPH